MSVLHWPGFCRFLSSKWNFACKQCNLLHDVLPGSKFYLQLYDLSSGISLCVPLFFFSSAWELLFSLMYKYIMFFKSTPKAPANNHTHPCIPLFNWASTFCTLVTSWAMQKPYFQLLKPASEKMSTTYILKDIVLWKPFFFHKIWPRKPMASLPTWSSNVFGCFQ